MIVFTNIITPRLEFISDFIGREIIGKPLDLTTDVQIFKNYSGQKINYTSNQISDQEIRFSNHSLLFETGIREQDTSCFLFRNKKVFFKSDGDLPFDIFAASFYLLTRYEEYLPHKKDKFGRYAHENALAFKENFLQLPLINFWLDDFRAIIKNKFPTFIFQHSSFNFQPTYDIDEAFAYLHKELIRSAGGMVKSIVKNESGRFTKRMNVLAGKEQDPYDSFQWMAELSDQYGLKPIYFFHVAEKNGQFDKNISPAQPAMKQLIKSHAEKYTIGIHPSWRSGDELDLLEKEKKTLESVSGKRITNTRHHYIRFILPETFRLLIRAGLTDDYSMGYGGINGFRASVASSFYWYDLEEEETTGLKLHPFCFMEATSFFQQKNSIEQTLDELMHYLQITKKVGGNLITVFHNNIIGTDKLYEGWRDMYKKFISKI